MTTTTMAVAVDLENPEAAVATLREAGAWASRAGTRLDVLHVEGPAYETSWISDPAVRAVVEREAVALRQERTQRLEAMLGTLPEETRGQVQVLSGDPVDALVEAGTRYEALLVATHGRRGLDRLWSGSVAEHVVRRAPCAVIVLRLWSPEG